MPKSFLGGIFGSRGSAQNGKDGKSPAGSYKDQEVAIDGPSASEMQISGPYNVNHKVHVGYNASTGQFTGVPEPWLKLLHTQIR